MNRFILAFILYFNITAHAELNVYSPPVNIPAQANKFVTSVSAAGIGTLSQPAFAGIAGSVDLTTQVTGALPIANGGSNNGSLSVAAGAVYYGDEARSSSARLRRSIPDVERLVRPFVVLRPDGDRVHDGEDVLSDRFDRGRRI